MPLQECRFTKAEVQEKEIPPRLYFISVNRKAFPSDDAKADVIKFIEHLLCLVKAILYLSLLYPLLTTTHQT